jgi:hypothetical protein
VAQEQGEKDRYNYNAFSPDGDLGHNGFLSLRFGEFVHNATEARANSVA